MIFLFFFVLLFISSSSSFIILSIPTMRLVLFVGLCCWSIFYYDCNVGTMMVFGFEYNNDNNNIDDGIDEHDNRIIIMNQLQTILQQSTYAIQVYNEQHDHQLSSETYNTINQYETFMNIKEQQKGLMNEANKKQMNHFITILNNLSIARQEQLQTTQPAMTTATTTTTVSDNDDNDENVDSVDNKNFLHKNQFSDIVLATEKAVLHESEVEFYNVINDHIENNINTLLLLKNNNIENNNDDNNNNNEEDIEIQNLLQNRIMMKQGKSNNKSSSTCLTADIAAPIVQEEIQKYQNDKIGIIDICNPKKGLLTKITTAATSYCSIVHEMTSPTYHPTTTTSSSTTTTTLGNVWWNKYIPFDWEEYILPKGWENIKDPSNDILKILNYWFHLFGMKNMIMSSSNHQNNNRMNKNYSNNAPPETVFHTNTAPGSCWPMMGTKGIITIRLPKRNNINDIITSVDAITIDHVSRLNLINSDTTIQSAPKYIKVYGFYESSTTATDNGLGFDISSKHLLSKNYHHKRIMYNIHTVPGTISSIQTFPLSNKKTTTQQPKITNDNNSISSDGNNYTNNDGEDEDEYDDDDEEDDDGTTCSPTKPTCSAGGESSPRRIAAIQLEILNNWGNEDYTCLYRIRVHSGGTGISPI